MSEEFNNENVVYEYLGRIMGLNAYELAVRNGFDGTEEEWLDSLNSKVLSLTKATSGNVNTYTMTFSNGNTQTFTVNNGKEIASITKQSSTATDSTLLITFNDGTTITVTVPNGNGIDNISGPVTNGIIDTYTIHYTNGTTRTFTIKNSIDTEPIDFTPHFTEGFNYVLNSGIINRYLPFTPVITDDNPLIDSFMTAESHPYRDGSTPMQCVGIKVSAGQMFKISAHHSYPTGTTLVFAEGYTSPIVKEVIQTPLDDYYYYIRKDGWIFVNSTIAFTGTSVKKVTIFDEVELNQQKLNTALASIPTVNAVRDAVLATLSIAEGSEF